MLISETALGKFNMRRGEGCGTQELEAPAEAR